MTSPSPFEAQYEWEKQFARNQPDGVTCQIEGCTGHVNWGWCSVHTPALPGAALMFEKSTSDARPDTHECLAGQKCRDTRHVDGKQRPAQTEKPDTLCRRCTRSVQSAIQDLPRDYVALHVSLGEASRSAGPRVRSSRTAPLPIDKHKFALMTAISWPCSASLAAACDA